MRVGSLFSGIGGLDLGLERAGMQVAWQVENDEFCQRVLAKHWPDVPRYSDVREVDFHELEPVDVLAGGFPCQNTSKASVARTGLDGEASGLWADMHRAIRDLRPRYVVVENVVGLLGVASRPGFDRVLGDLAEVGYDAEWDCLPAAAVGAPHIRDRVYLVAYPGGERHRPPEETVFAGWASAQLHGGWTPQPDVGRVAHGLPGRVDRLRALGNAVVPQVAEWVGRRIMEAEPCPA